MTVRGRNPEASLGREELEEAAASRIAGAGDQTGQIRAGGGCGDGDGGRIA